MTEPIQTLIPIAATQAQVEAIWWMLSWIILPSIAASYGFTLACLKWLYGEIKELRTNDLAHVIDRLNDLEGTKKKK